MFDLQTFEKLYLTEKTNLHPNRCIVTAKNVCVMLVLYEVIIVYMHYL